MKPVILFLIILLSVTGILIQTGCDQQKDEQMVLLPAKDDPTVAFRIWFKVGSQNDPEGKEGLAVLTASILTDGSTQQHTLEEILEELYPMAAGINSQVDKEMTVIYGRTHKDNLNDYYGILKEVILEPGFTESDFNRIKSDLVNYIEKTLRYSNDEELGKEVLSEFVYQGTPYGHIEEGHLSSLNSITIEDVKSFYRTHYNRSNVVIGLAGGYPQGFADTVLNDLRQLPEGSTETVPAPIAANIDGLEIKIVEKDANATAISFGFPIDVVRGSRDFYALAIANSWLGEHRNSSSHLYKVIREARGLNYGDYSYIEHFPQGGTRQFPPANVARRKQLFQVWIRPVPNEARLFAFRAALRELQKLIDNGMSEQDFQLTRKFLKNYVLHYAPTNMMRLGYALDDRFYDIKGSHLENFRNIIDKITLEEVNAAIRKHLQYENIKVVFVTDNAKELKEMLVKDMPSPIEYQTPKPEEIMQEDKLISEYPLKVNEENIEIIPVENIFK